LSVEDRLMELDFGVWEGRSWDTVGRTDLDRWAESVLTFAPPGGESGEDLIARIRDFHARLRLAREDCVVVSHGGPLKVLNALLFDKPIDLLAAAPAFGSVTYVVSREP
jgi:alpha-ribazole phosphatase